MKVKQALHWKKDPDSKKAKRSGLWLWVANYIVSSDHKGTQGEKQCLVNLYPSPKINY